MKYDLEIGNKVVRIHDENNLIHLDFDFFAHAISSNTVDADCNIKLFSDDINLPKGIFRLQGKLIEGVISNKLYSILVNRKVVIVSDKVNKVIDVYVEDNSINVMSIYSIFVCLKKHVAYTLFDEINLALHASAVYNSSVKKAYVILGKSGSGKSSLSYYFIQHGMELLADDILCMNSMTGRVSGSGGSLYVTDDFIHRFDIKKYQVVNPGRKARIDVPNIAISDIEIEAVLIAKGQSEQNAYEICDVAKYQDVIFEMQKKWMLSIGDKDLCKKKMNKLIENIPKIYVMYLNHKTMENIGNLIVGELK